MLTTSAQRALTLTNMYRQEQFMTPQPLLVECPLRRRTIVMQANPPGAHSSWVIFFDADAGTKALQYKQDHFIVFPITA
jgi:hypothetical protein